MRESHKRDPQSLRQSPPRIVVRLIPAARHCAFRRRNVKQLFFKFRNRENQDLRSLKRLFRAAEFSTCARARVGSNSSRIVRELFAARHGAAQKRERLREFATVTARMPSQ
jgi:hypothetical protein